MTKNILLIDADSDSVNVVTRAAALTGHAVRLATRSDEAFRILNCNFADVDVVVADVDPALTQWLWWRRSTVANSGLR